MNGRTARERRKIYRMYQERLLHNLVTDEGGLPPSPRIFFKALGAESKLMWVGEGEYRESATIWRLPDGRIYGQIFGRIVTNEQIAKAGRAIDWDTLSGDLFVPDTAETHDRLEYDDEWTRRHV